MSGTVPKLRFPGFAGAWPSQLLGDFIDEYREKSTTQDQHEVLTSARSGIVRQRDYFESDRLSERDNVGFNIIPPGYITYRSRSDDRRFYFNRNDLGITGIISIFYPVFRLIECDPKFFTALLDRYVDEIGKYSVGTSQTVLSLNQLRKISLPLPSLVEQAKIGSILSTVDAKLEALRRKKSGLEAFKSGLMQRLFSQELRFTRDDGSEFPEWEENTLGELGSFSKGKGISKSDIAEDGDLPCIRYGELYTQYSERITNIVSRTDVSPSSLTLSQVNDVIIPASGETPIDMARACCVLVSGAALGGDINIFRSQLNGEYLAYLLTNARRTEIAQMAQGNSVVHLYPAQLRQIIVPVPHPDEQRKIADALSAMDAKIAAVANQITHMETFKKGLLQQMFV